MIIWIIAAVYQGDFTGIELATANEAEAEERYEELVRTAMGIPHASWKRVEQEYGHALDSCLKVDEYYLEEVEVED